MGFIFNVLRTPVISIMGISEHELVVVPKMRNKNLIGGIFITFKNEMIRFPQDWGFQSIIVPAWDVSYWTWNLLDNNTYPIVNIEFGIFHSDHGYLSELGGEKYSTIYGSVNINVRKYTIIDMSIIKFNNEFMAYFNTYESTALSPMGMRISVNGKILTYKVFT